MQTSETEKGSFPKLKDNQFGEYALEIPAAVISTLLPFDRKKLKDWVGSGVSVFRGPDKNDGSKDSSVFELSKHEEGKPRKIITSNSMGVVRLRNVDGGEPVQIEIGSRFDTGDNQFFFAYMLSKVFGGSIVGAVDLSKDSLWDMLLAFAFRRKLLDASNLGLFREYRTFHHNDMRLRGRIDVARHLRQNVPFQGNVAYATHEISFDNPTNHLIRHALEKISRKWGWALSGDSNLARLTRELSEQTPSWSKHGVLTCVSKKENRMQIRHPFFQTAYEPLRKLSLSILRDEGAGLYQQEQEAEGVIFDGAWLWEEYVWTLLGRLPGYEHPENKAGAGAWNPLCGITLFPDYFNCAKRVVLDAKYQRFNSNGDNYKHNVKQVLGYMLILDATHGGLIYPDGMNLETETETIKSPCKSTDESQRPKWHKFGLQPYSEATTAAEFVATMKKREDEFLKRVDEAIR